MLLLNKKSQVPVPFDVEEFESVGIKTVYQFKATKSILLIKAISDRSVSELRRKMKEGAVWIGNEKALDPDEVEPVGNVAVTVFVGKELEGIIIPRK